MFVMYLLLVLCWFVFECYVDHGDLHVLTPSFPTRLSSDRWRRATVRATIIKRHGLPRFRQIKQHWCVEQNPTKRRARLNFTAEGSDVLLVSGISHSCGIRSEEHTSELQSLMRTSYAVFCLKKTKTHIIITPPKQIINTEH